ncbi:MAG: sigma-54-dependent Fis family transcriptional regulator [Gammaproteobacteria bacterium]|nr:sigma-54-dependent Fis family transcriptional regulator [Gammaproteobacteria bacterium]MDP6166936.1 sigma-54 dependent transcriptional regulator [Gammaproteobacteria bacterium]
MSDNIATVALLDSQHSGLDMLTELTHSAGMVALPAADQHELAVLLNRTSVDLLVVNATSLDMPLVAIFKQLADAFQRAPVFVLVNEQDVHMAVQAMHLGAIDVMTLPLEPGRFKRQLAQYVAAQPQGFICRDGRSQQLLALAERVAQTDVTILIGGESGAGKEVLAQHVHLSSPRKKGEFVAVNCASIPETMLEDMLFGHEKGAFTGAHQRHQGLFEQAQGGTLFLDEVGELPFVLQAKLLRVIQERELKRLGGNETIVVDARIIAATNRNLQQEVQAQRFREDLYYRINVFPLKLLPLKQRPLDILPIAQFLLHKHKANMGATAASAQYNQEALNFLQSYAWPGNVRELENVVQRALVLAVGGVIGMEHLLVDGGLEDFMEQMPSEVAVTETPEVEVGQEQETAAYMQATGTDGMNFAYSMGRQPEPPVIGRGLSEVARDSEQKVILATLKRFKGSRKDTAQELGVSPRTLRYKLAKMKDQGVHIPG